VIKILIKHRKENVMHIIKAGYEILDELNGEEILKKIERVARVCYKSEDKITEGSAERMVKALIKRGHEAMLEHFSFSVKFTVDRGVSHEIVRHRVASFAQESTRYCNYGKSGTVAFIRPCYFEEDTPEMGNWIEHCMMAETDYLRLLYKGNTPEQARAVLPTSVKTDIVMTANLREWRHFFKLRAVGVTGKPHPQMLEVAVPLLAELKELIPVVFDDLEV
jgi:thymidylate synthase (FAD)